MLEGDWGEYSFECELLFLPDLMLVELGPAGLLMFLY